jgi:hypothetical protein
MDGLSFHPYPNRATDPLSRGYAWPNAGFVNLDRVKQAIWDAFAGTAQPTTLYGLPLYLDEVGWQVDTTGRDGYEGDENVAVTNEETQADVYGALVRAAACDPDVAAVNLFGFRDDALRTGFQAGLSRVDGSERPALGAVRDAIASPACAAGAAARWHPSRAVIGATRPNVRLAAASVVVDLRAAEGASARVCLLRGAHTLSSARRALTSRPRPGICVSGSVEANRLAIFRLPRRAGRQTLAVRLAADANAARSSTAVRPLPRCLTPNTCSGRMRTDVRSPRTRPDRAARGGGPAALGAFRG